MAADENVLCFERKLLDEAGVFQGLSLDIDKYLAIFTAPANLTYRPRKEAEQDKRYKQLIPYVLIVSGDRVLRYRRGSGGEETRLHGLYSVGIGGHISDTDHELFSTSPAGYYDGMRRELKEEIDLDAEHAPAVAVINDDSTDVGAVHFGVVHLLRVRNEDVAGHRKGIVAPEFIPVSKTAANLASYESWSRFCLENFETLLARAGKA